MGDRINSDVGVILGQGLLFISAYVRLAGLWAPGVFCLHPSHHKICSGDLTSQISVYSVYIQVYFI